MPMFFIVTDLISKFNPSPKGHQYVITVIGMLMNYTWYILLHTKEADEPVHAYFISIYLKFGRTHKSLSGHATETKKKLFAYFFPLWE